MGYGTGETNGLKLQPLQEMPEGVGATSASLFSTHNAQRFKAERIPLLLSFCVFRAFRG